MGVTGIDVCVVPSVSVRGVSASLASLRAVSASVRAVPASDSGVSAACPLGMCVGDAKETVGRDTVDLRPRVEPNSPTA